MFQQPLTSFFPPASEQSKVAEYIEQHQFLTNWQNVEHDGWRLPATKEPHYWCGIWKTVGCLNVKSHQNLGYGKRIYVKQFQRSCYRGACRTCYQKWIARESNKATRRINTYSELSKEKSIHLLLSIPERQYHIPIPILRKKMSVIIKDIKLKGAMIIFHPFRFNSKERRFYYSPHFHLVGFGYPLGISDTFSKHGWFIKNLGARNSVFQTISYLMSHCGIRKGNHAVTWIGRLSYSKLKVEKEPPNTHCPCCGEKFVEIYCNSYDPVVPPEKMYEGLVDELDWHEVNFNSQY